MVATSSRVVSTYRNFAKARLQRATAAAVECLEQRMLLSVGGSDPELVANALIGVAAGVADSLPSGFITAPDSAPIVSKDQLVSFDARTRTQKVYSVEESRAIAEQLGITLPANQTSPSMGMAISADVPGSRPAGLASIPAGKENFPLPLGFPFGTDGRTHLTDTTSWPYSPVGRQYMVFGGSGFFGSGTMIGRSFELTAGHCVYDYEGGAGWPSQITFSAAQDGTGIDGQRSTFQPYGQANWVQAWAFTGWTSSGDWNYDMGWVQLDRNLGDYTGWYGYGYSGDDNYYWNTARNTGHPGDLSWNGMQTYTQIGVPRDYGITADQLQTNTMDVFGGQSGGPLEYDQVIHGVVSSEWSSGGTRLYNMFTRMTSTKFNAIQGIMDGATAPTDYADLVDYGSWYNGDYDWFTPSTVRPGDSFTAHSVALNIGTAGAGSFTVRFRLSSDTTYDAEDYFLSDATVSSLDPFAWAYADGNGTFPSIPSGQYYLVWSIDAFGSVSEFVEGNNLGYDDNLVTVAPANDMFASRTNLGSVNSVTATGSNAWSTGETGEPAQSGAINSAWWSWTAPSNGTLSVDTFGSGLDTFLTLATGSAVNSLTVLAQNDDVGGLQSQISGTAVVAGTQYQIAVDGFDADVGAIKLNLSFIGTGEIHGTEWNDLDGDGVRDSGEPALANWRVYLDGNTNGQWDTGETSVLTDASGNYAFLGLPAGTYTVAQVLQTGWMRTYPGDPLLGIAWDGMLYDVNKSIGAAGNPRNTGVTEAVGITASAAGTVYVLNAYSGLPGGNSLYTIDPVTGLATLVGTTGLSVVTEGDLDFDPTTGVLYGMQDQQSSRMLFTINPVTGLATTVGAMEDQDMSAMAFSAAGTLYALDTSSDRVLTIDKATGATLTAVPLSTGLGAMAGMDFDRVTGELYVADSSLYYSGTNSVYRLNATTGQLTLVGPTGLTGDALSGLTVQGNGAHTVVLAAGEAVTGRDFGNRQNSAPTDIALSASSIAENQPVGTAVGTLSSSDPDAGNTFTYSLVSGTGSTDNASFSISGNQLLAAASFDFEAKSSYSIRVRTTDQGGLPFEKVFTITVTDVDEIAPTVTAIYVRGSTWASGYLSFLAANMAGSSSTYGFAIPAGSGAAQLQTLPWRNLNRISMAFSEDVSVSQAQFAIIGSVGSYSVSGFSYSSADHVATWSLSAAIGPDKLYVAVPGSGTTAVRDAAGNVLDGEWSNPTSYSQVGSTSSFPSGNGTAGGDFAFRFDVLPGDSTGGSLGKVNVADVAQTKSRSTLAVSSSSYRSDFDGNNLINVADVAYVKSKSSIYSLPVNPPVLPVFGPVFSQVSLLQELTGTSRLLV